jgi:hypothetical protein
MPSSIVIHAFLTTNPPFAYAQKPSLLHPLTLSLSHQGRGNPETDSSDKCKPL